MSKVKELLAELKNQGSFRDQYKKLKEFEKNLKEEARLLKEKIPHIKFGTKRVMLSEKGAISFYGLQKFPVTLYLDQVNDLKQMINSPEFRRWIEENRDQLKSKKDEQEEKAS